MATQKRQSHPPIIDSLFEQFYSFSFFKAVHLLETHFPKKKPFGKTFIPEEEVVRFTVKPGLTFPPSDIANMEWGSDGSPNIMEVAFMGLIGRSGVLPHWYNELAIERVRKERMLKEEEGKEEGREKRGRKKEPGLIAFFDMFHHRLISLFYLAWKRYRFAENYFLGARDQLSGYLLSLVGLGTPGLTASIGVPEESLIYYSGLLSRQVPCAFAIASTIEFYAGTTVAVEQFVDRKLFLSPEDFTRVGKANAELGLSAVCGSYVWENQTKFRVKLGPVGYDNFTRFLPTGDMLRPIFAVIRQMVGIEFEFDVQVVLKREEVPPCILGAETEVSPRLGWSTWVKSAKATMPTDPRVTFQSPEP